MEIPGGPSTAESAIETSTVDSDALFKELGFDLESREKTLSTLESMFGERVFHYGEYSGTVSDMANSCPAFGDILEQGAPSAAAWLEANDQPQKDKQEGSQLEEIKEALETEQGDTAKQEAVIKSKPDETRTKSEANRDTSDKSGSKTKDDTTQARSHIETETMQDSNTPTEATTNFLEGSKSKAIETTADISTISDSKTAKDKGGDANQPVTLAVPSPKTDTTTNEVATVSQVVSQQSNEAPEFTAPSEALDKGNEDSVPPEIIESIPDESTDSNPLESEVIDGPDFSDADSEDISGVEVASELDDAELPLVEEVPEATDEIDIAAFEDNPDETNENDSESEVDGQKSIDTVHSDTGILLEVMKNEIEDTDSEAGIVLQETELQEDEPKEPAVQTLQAEILELLSAIIDDTPELDIEKISVVKINQQATMTLEIIEVLEKAKTAEECREALKYVRLELASLLELLGYRDPNAIADQLVKQYGMLELKKYIAMLISSLAHSPEFTSGKTRPLKAIVSPRHYGAHAVKSVVNLTFAEPIVQAA